MNIKQQLENLKSWAKENDILLVDADFQEGKIPTVKFANTKENPLEIYKELVLKLDIKVIICDTIYFDSGTFKIYDETIEQLGQDYLKEKLLELAKLENSYISYSLHIFNNGVNFMIEDCIDEISDFLLVQDSVHEFIEESDSGNVEPKGMPEQTIKEFAKRLAEHENYAKLRNRVQRENLAKELFGSSFDDFDIDDNYATHMVVARAESYFEIEIKPKKEMELKQKIKDLLGKGWTKVKIAAEIGVSKDTVNKYA
jgi:hypothetical protein